MSHPVIFSSTARQDLHTIPPRILPAIIEFIYGDLAASPRRVGKPLSRELSGIFSARRGSYRILYDIRGDGTRGDEITSDDIKNGDINCGDNHPNDIRSAIVDREPAEESSRTSRDDQSGMVRILRVDHRSDIYR
ncbi:type II toxin-antitoxin system RelE family toxin [Subtercola frigoramans]|uniref:mRNA-degrading endonuclease RelE of RelBE toxin-antitoxin system n=1 Tax=Subtercola frigoramans TaxID=120298 RepID=A0ABS2L561_9MICO|nr:type II toxin-antitoxin system RelE/ParE family toxin [Subtercola frigoramans]MBM7472207.1 mRNA-degrading endonuclease RelE of RelBE toxin-antitoxin system [Subtercola frigoramans]